MDSDMDVGATASALESLAVILEVAMEAGRVSNRSVQ